MQLLAWCGFFFGGGGGEEGGTVIGYNNKGCDRGWLVVSQM